MPTLPIIGYHIGFINNFISQGEKETPKMTGYEPNKLTDVV